jgi:hypothetical protein
MLYTSGTMSYNISQLQPRRNSRMTPIATAVQPLKTDAIERAEKDANDLIDRIEAALSEHGWDIDKAAPRGNAFKDGSLVYKSKMAKHRLYLAVTTYTQPTRRPGEPHIRRASPENRARFIAESRQIAAAQYDAFVAKLEAKVGTHTAAILTGNHVWGSSLLTVDLPDGRTERWTTKQIVNVSSLGKLFNQWPTRRVK